MWKELKFKITSAAPLIMHNGQLCDPLNHFTKEMKKISSKRNKTEADFEKMSHIEWFGGLYVQDKKPIIPGIVFEATCINAARKNKWGKLAQRGMQCLEDFELIYDGPKDLEKMFEDDRFRLVRKVKVQRNSVMRTRPIFPKWEANIEMQYDDEILNLETVQEIIRIAGEQIGLMDWRPKYGRFTVEY